MNTRDAKSIAFGSRPSITLSEYYSAWQYLYDNKVILSQGDLLFLDKLICDGSVIAVDDYWLEGYWLEGICDV